MTRFPGWRIDLIYVDEAGVSYSRTTRVSFKQARAFTGGDQAEWDIVTDEARKATASIMREREAKP